MSFDARTAGTSVTAWRSDDRFATAPPLDLDGVTRLVVVAAHPDDETLGAGGLIAGCAERGIDITIVIVTDGGASHPGDRTIADRRSREAVRAIATLATSVKLRLLGYPDGRTDVHRPTIRLAINRAIGDITAGTRVAAPWRGDGHRDHRVVGEIVADLVPAEHLWEYPIWMWHWAEPDHPAVPWHRARRASIDPSPKARAIAEYRTQTEGDEPQLLPSFLEHFRADTELFFVAEAVSMGEGVDTGGSEAESQSVSGEHFDALYRRRDDPWRVETRWYEERKRALTLAMLPHRSYERALEVGCSIGVLTEGLAARVTALDAIDVSAEAVARARARLDAAGVDGVVVEQRDVGTVDPAERYDLIVLSEVGYYLDAAALERALDRLIGALTADGVLVACHWRRDVDGIPSTGDRVHGALARRPLQRVARYLDDDVVIDVVTHDGLSVAQREGFA